MEQKPRSWWDRLNWHPLTPAVLLALCIYMLVKRPGDWIFIAAVAVNAIWLVLALLKRAGKIEL